MKSHPWEFTTGLALVAIGAIIIFAGSALANLGDQIDSLVGSKYTGIVLAAIGGFLLYAAGKKAL